MILKYDPSNSDNNIYKCDYCGLTLPLGESDDLRGAMCACCVCDHEFCAACFDERHGTSSFREMQLRSGNDVCPDCYKHSRK